MKLLTDKQIEELKSKMYNKGWDDATFIHKQDRLREFQWFCDYILDELEELKHNTWDKERITNLKDLVVNKLELERIKQNETTN